MANVWYPEGLYRLMSKDIDLINDQIMVALVDDSYVYDDTDTSYSDISGNVIDDPIEVGAGSPTSKTLTKLSDRVAFDANDVSFTSIPAGSTVGALVLYYTDGGSPATTYLLTFLDSGVGLPYSTDGGNIPIGWSNAASKIAAIKTSES